MLLDESQTLRNAPLLTVTLTLTLLMLLLALTFEMTSRGQRLAAVSLRGLLLLLLPVLLL